MNIKERYDGLDLLKAIAIGMVLTLHVDLWAYDFIEEPNVVQVLQYALRLVSEGVPIFLMINGFLLLRKETFDLNKHLKKISHIFLLVLIWGTILTIVGNALSADPVPLTLKMLLYYLAKTQVSGVYTGVLWFLQVLTGVYILFPLIWKAYHQDFKLYLLLFVVVAFYTAGLSCAVLVQDYLNVYHDGSLINEFINFFYRFNSIGDTWAMFYFMLGGIIYHFLDWVRAHRIILIAAGFLAWLIATGYGIFMSRLSGSLYNPAFNYSSVFMPLIVTGLFCLVLPFHCGVNRFKCLITTIGKNSMGIYLTHYLFIYIINHYYSPISLWQRIFKFFIVLCCSWLLSVLIKKIPHLCKLISL